MLQNAPSLAADRPHEAFRNDFVDPLRKKGFSVRRRSFELRRTRSVVVAYPNSPTPSVVAPSSYAGHRSGNANAVPTAS
ncbi:MAG: hypothetical protein ACPG3X_00530, partial [Opitutales bacterium]